LHFLSIRRDGLFRGEREGRITRGLGRGIAGPTATGGGALREEALHDPVLDGMKRHDGELAARLQRAFGGAEGGDELAQLIIHGDAERLERTRRGVALAWFLARQAALDDARQVQRGLDRCPGALGHDGAGDPARGAFLTVEMDDVGQKRLGRVGHKVGGARPRLTHAHVQGPVAQEGKTPLRAVELHGGDAEVQRHPVQRRVPGGCGMAIELGERAGDKDQAVTERRGPVLGQFERQRIPVHPDHDIRPRFKQSTGVATSAEGAIEPHARNRADRPEDRRQKDGRVGRGAALPRH
jgi:hypothetical protein